MDWYSSTADENTILDCASALSPFEWWPQARIRIDIPSIEKF